MFSVFFFFLHLSFAWRKLGRYDQAVQDYSASLALHSKNLKTYNNRGYSYAKEGKYQEAIADYTKVIIFFLKEGTNLSVDVFDGWLIIIEINTPVHTCIGSVCVHIQESV